MKRFIAVSLLSAASLSAQQYKIAIIGMVHSHVWGHIGKMIEGKDAKLVGIYETEPDLIAEANSRGATGVPFYNDYIKLLDLAKPDIVWAFVENNRHLEIVKACAPRRINVIFEKPLASGFEDARAIRDLAKRHDIKVLTNYQRAWWASNYTAFDQAKEGAVGQVWRLRGVVGHGGPGGNNGLNRFFFAWLTDPVKNGAGALMDFGCYNALWSLWYLGRPDTVYAQTNQLRPETFPKVEDNSSMILSYKNGVGIFEGSWDLPRSFQDLEVFGIKGSLYMTNGKVELRTGRARDSQSRSLDIRALAPERSEPIAYMVHCLRTKQPIEGMVALDINVGVNEIIDAAKESVAKKQVIRLK